MSSPTSRTLAALKKEGWTCQVVERFNVFAKVRVDLYGFVDVLAIRPGETLAVQCTSADHVANRLGKLRECPGVRTALMAGWSVEVWGWRKSGPRGGRKVWKCRRVSVTAADVVQP